MATQDLGFNVFAHDRASRTFTKLAASVERLSDKLKELDRQRANPEIDVDVQKAMAQARRAARAFAEGAEDEGRRRKRGFFLAMFTPNRGIVMALRTGIPAVLGSPIGAAAVVLAGVFAASFAAAVLASGVFAAIAGGFTAIAVVALKENAKLQASFAELGQTAKVELAQAAQPLVPAFDDALNTVRGLFEPRIADPLQRIFEGLEPTIVPFVKSAVNTVGGILDTLGTPQFVTSMQTVLRSVSDNLPGLGQGISDLFSKLAKNADDIAEAFENVVGVTAGLLNFAADTVNVFTDLFNKMHEGFGLAGDALSPVVQGLRDVDRLLKQIQGDEQGGGIPNPFDFIAPGGQVSREDLQGVPNPLTFVAPFSAGSHVMDEAAASAEKFSQEIRGMSRAGEEAARQGLAEMAERQEQLTDAIDGTNDRLDHERDKLDQLKDTMFASAEGVLGLREAEVAYQEQLDATNATLEENGRGLDINTEKGQENRRSIDDLAESALQQIEAMIEQGEQTDKVSKFTQQARDDFIKAARAAGLEKDEAKALADQLGLVPSEVETKIKAIDEMSATIDSLKRQLRELQRQAGVIPIGTSTGAFFGSSLVVPRGHDGGLIAPEGIRRMHSGGTLGSDERVVIGQTGERILSRSQTRAFDAAGGMDGLRRGSDEPQFTPSQRPAEVNIRFTGSGDRYHDFKKAVRSGEIQLDAEGAKVTVA